MIGTCVSHYRILEKLGAGGMGEVFSAEDTHLARRVAIKFPSLDGHDGDNRGRFLTEARAASRLDHANIARVYDYGEAPDGRPFLVMELVKGTTLREALRDGPLPPARSIAIVESVLRALREAHHNGLVHRDIKPGNVMLAETGEVKVLDFGLAKEIAAAPTGRLSQAATAPLGLTAPGMLRGTPQYMSPEQARGHMLDQRSDLFSAGLVLYECLTGRAAFSGSTGHEVLDKVVHSEPPPPSSRAAGVPAALDRITAKALAKDAAERYQTADAMLEDLASASAALHRTVTRTVIAAMAGARLKWIGAATLAVALMAGLFLWRSRPHEPSPGAMHWYEIGAAALRDGTYYGAARALERAVELDPEFALAHARLAEARNELDDAAGADRAMLQALPPEGAPKLRRIDALYLDAIHRTLMRDFVGAIRSYTELAARVPEPDKAAVFVDLGRVREMNQENPKALEAYREAIHRDSQNAAAHLRAAILLAAQLEPHAAAEFAVAESLYRASSNTEGEIEVLYQRGYDARRRSKLAEARAALEKAGELAGAIHSEQQEIASALQLSIVSYMEGDPARAEEIAATAIERARRAGMTYLAARGLIALGAAQFGKQDYDRAEASFREALDISRKSQMPRTEAQALAWLANLHETTGAAEAALQEIEPALAYYEKAGFKVDTRQLLVIKGRLYRNLGRDAEALAAFQELLSLATASEDRRQMAIAEQGIARALFRHEDWPKALEHFKRYSEIARSIPDPEGIGRSLLGQADVLWRLGRPGEAERLLPEVEGLTLPAATAGSLAAIVAERRAGIALSRGKRAEALALARLVFEMKSAVPPMPALAKCLAGVALARAGSAGAGKALCGESVTALARQQDRFPLAEARIDLAEILLANGEPAAASEQVRQALEVIDPARHLESSWRAWLIAARAYRRSGDRARAAEALDAAKSHLADLRGGWPAEYFNSYALRSDLASLFAEIR